MKLTDTDKRIYVAVSLSIKEEIAELEDRVARDTYRLQHLRNTITLLNKVYYDDGREPLYERT